MTTGPQDYQGPVVVPVIQRPGVALLCASIVKSGMTPPLQIRAQPCVVVPKRSYGLASNQQSAPTRRLEVTGRLNRRNTAVAEDGVDVCIAVRRQQAI